MSILQSLNHSQDSNYQGKDIAAQSQLKSAGLGHVLEPEKSGQDLARGSVEIPVMPAIQAPIAAVGLNYQTAPVEIRSRFAIDNENLERFFALARDFGIEECIPLSTCNRSEIYYSNAPTEQVLKLLCAYSNFSLEEIDKFTYRYSCVQAATHLFRVASGLESAVVGETEIVAQIKEAWRNAKSLHHSGTILDLTFQKSLEAGKRVRTETSLCKKPISIGSLAVREASRQANGLEKKHLVVIGAGKIADRLLKELKNANFASLTIVNRTLEHAQNLASKFGCAYASLERMEEVLVNADVVFGACHVSQPIVTRDMVLRISEGRSGRPLVAIDLGLPPNFEAPCDGMVVIGIDSLNSHLEDNLQQRLEALPAAEIIIHQEIGKFNSALIERSVSPTIQALRERGHSVQARNVAWAKAQLGHLDEKDLKVVEELARKMVIGLLEAPIEGLKTNLATPTHQELVKQLFDLEVEQRAPMIDFASLE